MDRFSRLCLWGSMACAFLSLALLSFDVFPWYEVPFMPPRPMYPLACAGMLLFLLSGRWYGHMREHRGLLFLWAALLGCSVLSTWLGLQGVPHNIAPAVWLGLARWFIVPFCFLLWWAVMFSCLPSSCGKRLFQAALLVLGLSNLAHIVLEILANHGAEGIKNFLVSINPWFRMECIGHGWWPPPYFTDRVRGLFAEPSHMAFGLLPVLGLLLAKCAGNRLWLLGVAGWGIVMWQSKVLTGAVAFLLACIMAGGPWYLAAWRRHSRRVLTLSCVLLVLAGVGGWTLLQPKFERFGAVEQETDSILRFLEDSHAGLSPQCPELQGALEQNGSLGIRYACTRLDMAAGLSRVLGTGFYLRGFYWQPLDACSLERGSELRGFVQQAKGDKLRRVPPLNEYSVLLAEFGVPGLLLFLGLCGMLLWRSVRFAARNRDWYVYAMACAFMGMLGAFISTGLMNALVFTFFAGYLYAISGQRHGATSGAGSTQVPQPARG
ncbi:hypothetical protein [Desulfovibrio piger]|uniref:hypothetical protein n=1 Tax=Desulfovibrio piger TaxID=901 RepID=UPI0026F245D2|nr:hypothetical protein [Desulfovibrio piger]